MTDRERTERTRRSYDRIAPLYDLVETIPEWRYRPWRRRLWSLVHGPAVLEVGVGTGKNMRFYPPDARITAIDLSPRMLERARRRAATLHIEPALRIADAQALPFGDASFDDVVGTFVFCSIPDPVLGLREMRRALKPGGRLLLLEHVRAGNALLGRLMDLANPVAVRLTGVNINRRTIQNVELAGLRVERRESVGLRGIFQFIIARAD